MHQRGFDIAVFETADRAGGVIGTYRDAGFLVETGANSALDNSPLLTRLLDELGIAGERVEVAPAAAKRYVVRGGRPVALPMSPPALLTSPLFSGRAKLRLLREPFVARAAAGREETVATFVRRRLGPEVLDYAVDPFVSGVYAGDPEKLSIAAAFPRLHALEQQHGSLIGGQFANARLRKRQGEPVDAPRSFSFRDGMQTLTDALARGLPHYRGRTEAVAIERRPDGGFTLRTMAGGALREVQARAVVLATPSYAAAPMIASIVPTAAQALEAIAYAPVAIVATAYRREDVAHALDGFGMLVPRRERRQILGTLFSSTLFAGRAAPGHVLLTTFAGGRTAPELVERDDEALAAIVVRELAALLGAGSPRWSRVIRWRHAIPQYELGHRERVARALDAAASVPGLYLCGSWRDGVAVGERVTSGYVVAEAVRAFLRDPLAAAPA